MSDSEDTLEDLFAHNRAWAAQMERDRPGFFTGLVKQQTPRYMWIGCSDSRVPANQITGLEPGEVFVHRNVANIVVHSDLNALSAIQFAVEHLKVEHIMVVGHYGCAGVKAALSGTRIGLADNWIRHIQDVRDRHHVMLDTLPEPVRVDALCELNVAEQVVNVAVSTVMVDAWSRGQKVRIHGWCYGVHDGLLQDLRLSVDGSKPLDAIYKAAVQRIRHKWGKPAEPLVIPPRPRAESVVRTPPPAPTAQPTLEAPAAVGSSQDHVSPAP
jgi:carbonic anhydrase